MNRRLVTLAICLMSASWAIADERQKTNYDDDVEPILRQHCFACHNQDDPTSDLALDSFEGALAGGAGGEVLSSGDPGSSRLWKLVSHQEQPSMPPEEEKLPDDELAVIRRWIEGGLLQDVNSKPIERSGASVGAVEATTDLGKPVGEPAMPTGLFHEPVVWSNRAGAVDVLAASPWAPLVAVAWQRQVCFFQTHTHELLGVLPYLDGVPRVVRFSRDGSLVLIAGGRHAAAGSASLFDLMSGAQLTTVGDELDIVMAADVSPDMSLIAIGGPKKKVRVYRTADRSLAYELEKHTDWITALEFSPNGELLATADRSGGVRLWQAAAGHERGDLRGHTAAISSISWRLDSAVLATASEDKTIRLWNSEGAAIKSINAHSGGVLGVRFARDGRLVSAGRDRKVKTWKSDGAAIAEIATLPDIALAAEFTHDGAHVVASDYSGIVQLIDLAKNQVVAALPANPPTLAQRRAELASLVASKQSEHAQRKNALDVAVASLDAGRRAHAAHEKKLTAAGAKLAATKRQREEDEATRARREQALVTAKQNAAQAEATFAAAKKALEQSQEQDADDQEVSAAKELELAQSYAEAHQAHNRAVEAAGKAQAARDEAAGLVAKDEAKIASAKTDLATIENETAGLPDVEKLLSARQQAEARLAAISAQLAHAKTRQDRVIAQQVAFQSALDQLAANVTTSQTEREKLAKLLAGQQADHLVAAKLLGERRAETGRLQAELEQLQSSLQKLQTVEDDAATEADRQGKQLTKLQRQLSEAERRARMAEARRQAFEAAQELRKSLSDPR